MGSSLPARQPPAWYEAVDAVLDTDLPTTAKLLMVALIVRAGLKPDGTAYPSLRTLARKISIGQEKRDRPKLDEPRDMVRHVRRILKTLESKELVERNERSGMTTEYRVRWERLLDPGHQCPGSDSAATSNPGHPSPPTPDTDDLPPRTPKSSHPGHPCPPNLPLNLPNEPSPSNSTWREVEDELEKEGMAKATEAIAGTRKRGYTSEQALLVIQHYRANAGAWKPGALFARLTSVGSNIAIEEGWPDPAAAFLRDQQRAKEARQRATDAEAKREADKKRAFEEQQHANEIKRLESDFGPECDRLTDSAVSEIAKQDKLVDLQLRAAKKAKASPLTSHDRLRVYLLRHLAARSPPTATAETKTSDSRQRIARSEITTITAQGTVP